MSAPHTLEDLMKQALAMEREAVERYSEFADAMEVHNNAEVARLFRTMAGYEGKHAAAIMAQMGWVTDPPPPAGGFGWPDLEAPETPPIDSVHYLMQPWHALQIALASEQRAEAFFARLAAEATSDAVRHAALELQREEHEHVELVRGWMAKVPEPDPAWANDPDPPRYNE